MIVLSCDSKGCISKKRSSKLHTTPFPLHAGYMHTLLRPLTRPFPLLRLATTLTTPKFGPRSRFAKHRVQAYTTTDRRAAASMASVQQAEWRPPAPPAEAVQQALPKLSMYNSLTKSKNDFVPLDREGKKIGWYACGPTVYDDAVCFPFGGSWVGGGLNKSAYSQRILGVTSFYRTTTDPLIPALRSRSQLRLNRYHSPHPARLLQV